MHQKRISLLVPLLSLLLTLPVFGQSEEEREEKPLLTVPDIDLLGEDYELPAYYQHRPLSVTVWKGISPWGSNSDNVINYAVINLTNGRAAKLRGVELSLGTGMVLESVWGAQLGLIGSVAGNEAIGMQVGGLGAASGSSFAGLQLGGFGAVAGDHGLGVQAAGFGSVVGGSLNGAQLAGLGAVVGDNMGLLQAGGLAAIAGGKAVGLQLGGLASIAGEDLYGLQGGGLAAISGGSMNGLQLGGFAAIGGEQVNFLQGGGIAAIAGGAMNGGQIAGISALSGGSTQGLQAAGIAAITGESLLGGQLGGIAAITGSEMRGVQAASVAAIAGDGVFPLQLGGVAAINGGDLLGVQASGVASINGGVVRGIQLSGLANVTPTLNGAQLGLLNVTEDLYGLQVGLINTVGGELRGLPVGPVLNTPTSPDEIELYSDLSGAPHLLYRSGTGRLHVLLELATYQLDPYTWSVGWGYGTRFELSERFSIDADLIGRKINEGDGWTEAAHWSATARLLGTVHLNDELSLFAGPSFNSFGSTLNNGSRILPGYTEASTDGEGWRGNWVGAVVGLRLHPSAFGDLAVFGD